MRINTQTRLVYEKNFIPTHTHAQPGICNSTDVKYGYVPALLGRLAVKLDTDVGKSMVVESTTGNISATAGWLFALDAFFLLGGIAKFGNNTETRQITQM